MVGALPTGSKLFITRPMNAIRRARQLRRKQSWAEKALWRLLRDRRFSGYKFRRQHPFGEHFLDFYCAEAKLVIETDGPAHGYPARRARDAQRDELLRQQGIEVKRIWNWQLRRDWNGFDSIFGSCSKKERRIRVTFDLSGESHPGCGLRTGLRTKPLTPTLSPSDGERE
jgi:very-short-patch-repair endonuclease